MVRYFQQQGQWAMYNLTRKKGIINSIYYATFHNHLKVGNPEGIKGEQEIKKNRTMDGNLVNWQEPKGAKNSLEGHKMKKKKNLIHRIRQGTAVKERTVFNN